MTLTLTRNDQPVALNRFVFSGGETQVRIDAPQAPAGAEWCLLSHMRTGDDIMATLLTADAVRRLDPTARVRLVAPYLPYARQDRAAYSGESFALSVLAQVLKTARFDAIETWDVHSTVAMSELPGLVSVPASRFVVPVLHAGEYVVAPDAGAVERAAACSGSANPLVRATKHRDPNTGELCDPHLTDPLPKDANAMLVDDICDGGRTFLQLGAMLRGATQGRLRLFVTHGIFSQGIDALLDVFDEVLCANLINTDPYVRGRVTVVA